jgi:hypothetical protein
MKRTVATSLLISPSLIAIVFLVAASLVPSAVASRSQVAKSGGHRSGQSPSTAGEQRKRQKQRDLPSIAPVKDNSVASPCRALARRQYTFAAMGGESAIAAVQSVSHSSNLALKNDECLSDSLENMRDGN